MKELVEMTITRALSELKTLDKRISKANKEKFIDFYIKGRGISSGKTEKQLVEQIRGNYDSAKGLIDRRNAIKTAIVASNAITQVKIGEKSMTVAEAIERKRSIVYDKNLLKQMKSNYQDYLSSKEYQDIEIGEALSKLAQNDKISSDMLEKKEKSTKEDMEFVSINPNRLEYLIRELDKEIDEFELEVDYVLSTSNTVTMIKV